MIGIGVYFLAASEHIKLASLESCTVRHEKEISYFALCFRSVGLLDVEGAY